MEVTMNRFFLVRPVLALALFLLPAADADAGEPGRRETASLERQTHPVAASHNLLFQPLVAPCRAVDTRDPAGPFGGPKLASGETRVFSLGTRGFPCQGGSEISAYSLNITVTESESFGYLIAWGGEGPAPAVSTINYGEGTTIANAIIVRAASFEFGDHFLPGSINVAAVGGATHVIIDITGIFVAVDRRPLTVIAASPGTGTILGSNSANTNGSSGVAGSAVGSGEVSGVLGVIETVAGAGSAGVRGVARLAPGVEGRSGVAGRLDSPIGNLLASGFLGHRVGDANYGVYSAGNSASTGEKMFVEPHPTDASKVIRYVSLEGPEAGTYFRGRAKFERGLATIEVPEHFRAVTDPQGLSVQITPIGQMATYAVLKIGLDQIVVQGSRNVEFFYTINGVRRAFRDHRPIAQGHEFMPESPDAQIPSHLPEEVKLRLIQNGTYKENGEVNPETAERLGWNKAWSRQQK